MNKLSDYLNGCIIGLLILIGFFLGFSYGRKKTEKPASTISSGYIIYNDTDDNVYISTTTEQRTYDIYCSLPYYPAMISGLSYSQINNNVNSDFQYLETKVNEVLVRLQKLEGKK